MVRARWLRAVLLKQWLRRRSNMNKSINKSIADIGRAAPTPTFTTTPINTDLNKSINKSIADIVRAASTPTFTTTPINTDLREPRGSYSPGSRKTKDYSTESEVEMKKGGLVKKKTITKKKK